MTGFKKLYTTGFGPLILKLTQDWFWPILFKKVWWVGGWVDGCAEEEVRLDCICNIIALFTNIIAKMCKGLFINDVTQVGGGGFKDFVTLCRNS